MRKTAKAMALLTAASMIITAFTPVYAESTDTEDTAAVDWENGENIKAIKEKGVITVATGTYVPFEYRDDDDNIVVLILTWHSILQTSLELTWK